MRARLIVLFAALAAVLLLAVPALAAPGGQPVRFWELDKIVHSSTILTI